MTIYFEKVAVMTAVTLSILLFSSRSYADPVQDSKAHAKQLRDAGTFDTAQGLIEKRLASSVGAERKGLRISLAELFYAWAEQLEAAHNYTEAIKKYQAAYAIDQELRLANAVLDLNNIALNYKNLGDLETAIVYYKRALPKLDQIAVSDRITILNNVGLAYQFIGDYDASWPHFQTALELGSKQGDKTGQATALIGISLVDQNHAQFATAMAGCQKALQLLTAPDQQRLRAITWSNMAKIYLDLGQPKYALEYVKRAEAVYEESPDPQGEARALTAKGLVMIRNGLNDEAETAFSGARARFTQIHDIDGLAALQNNAAQQYDLKDKYDRAFELYTSARNTYHSIPNTRHEAYVLDNMGSNRARKGLDKEAEQYHLQALELFLRIGDRSGQASCLDNRMRLCVKQGQYKVAIAFGKASLNITQGMRREIQQLGATSQRAYLKVNRPTYENLAALLSTQARMDEAEQVLRLLRQEDALEFASRDTALARDIASLLEPLQLTSDELSLLPPQLRKLSGTGQRESELWHRAITQLDTKTALISTFNIDEGFWVVLTTATMRQMFRIEISRSEFDALCKRLRSQLASRDSNPIGDAQRLYKIVFFNGELESALNESGIERVLWFPSGALRSIPIDALHNGHSYLIEKPRLNLYVTLISRQFLGVPEFGKMLAVGASEASPQAAQDRASSKERPFAPLGNVQAELRAIVNDPLQDGRGPFSGQILLNRDFTASKFEAALPGAKIVHVATHFRLHPSSEPEPFFLLGDGSTLSLSQWKNKFQLKGVSLLTLSACDAGANTGEVSTGDISSIAEVSQWLGAESVLASQWLVSDASAPKLMENFYWRWKTNPDAGKGAALRGAQLDMLHDTTSTLAPPKPGEDKKDLKSNYSHPFYWAGFQLTGNWR